MEACERLRRVEELVAAWGIDEMAGDEYEDFANGILERGPALFARDLASVLKG